MKPMLMLAGTAALLVSVIFSLQQQESGSLNSEETRLAREPVELQPQPSVSVVEGPEHAVDFPQPAGPGRDPSALAEESARQPAAPRQPAATMSHWLQEFREAAPERRAELLPRGRELAAEHREQMRELIPSHPEEALRQALSPAEHAALPEELREGMPEWVQGEGFFGMLMLCNHSPSIDPLLHAQIEHEIEYDVYLHGQEYNAHVYGERLMQHSAEETELVGLALDGELALAEGATFSKELPDGEVLVLTAEGEQVFDDAVAAFEYVEERLAAMNPEAGETFDPITPPSSATPPWDVTYDRYTGTNSHQKGVKTIMFIYARGSLPDDPNPPRKSDAVLRDQAEDASTWFYDVSYRQTWFGNKSWSGTPGPGGEDYVPMIHVTPTVTLQNDASYYNSNTFGTTRSHLIAAVRALGGEYAAGKRLDPSNFDRITFYMLGSDGKGKFGNGLAYVTSNFMWASGNIDSGAGIHELGHNWGVVHANSWEADDTGITRSAGNKHNEYGGAGDVMGGSGPFSVMFKQKLGFLKETNARGETEVLDVTTGGTYRLFDHTDVDARNPTSALRGLVIPVDGFNTWDSHLILGFRHYLPGSSNPSFYRSWGWNAVELLSDGTSTNSSQNDGSHYLDTSPYSYANAGKRGQGNGDDKDGAIPLGRTYSEAGDLNGTQLYGGFHITPVARGQETDDAGTPGDPSDDTTHEWIDVKIVYNDEVASNSAPEITGLVADKLSVAVGESVTLDVSASDADGDELYYWWKFHEVGASSDNQPQQSLSWSSAGNYYVTVHVSDGKGGVAVEGIRIDVGNPGPRYEIHGRILKGGQPVVGAKLWISSPGPSNQGEMYHDAFSQSDGSYTFSNLSSGSYTFKAVHPTVEGAISPASHTVSLASSSSFGNEFEVEVSPPGSYTPQLTSIVVSPGYAELSRFTDTQYTAQGYDQHGVPMSVSPVWSVDGGGSIDATGLFSASTQGGPFTVTATVASLSGTGTLEVVPAKPLVQILSQGFGLSTETYVFEAEASDPDGSVAKVDFYIDDVWVGEDSSSPFRYELSSPVQGIYGLEVVATDNDGLVTTSLPKTLYIVDSMPASLKFNIEAQSYSPTPAGYIKLDQSVREGFNNGFYYGWSNKNSNASKYKEWNTGPGDSGSFPDEAHDTYVEMDRYAAFKVRVPNGTYQLRMGMSSLTTGNLRVKLDVNGDRLIDESWDRSANSIFDKTVEVEVTNNWISLSNPQYDQLWSFIEIVPDGAVMSVSAGADGDEHTPRPIEFTLTREANFSEAFTLNFSLAGTAEAADYSVSGASSWDAVSQTGTIAYAASDTDKVITVTPVQDAVTEGTETLQFNMEEGTGYSSGNASAQASILDAQTDYPPTVELIWPSAGTSSVKQLGDTHWLEVLASDDLFAGAPLRYQWEKVSGPGAVSFSHAQTPATRVSLDTAGVYELRCRVEDDSHSVAVTVTIEQAASILTDSVPQGDLIGHWKLDEPSGSVVGDASGNGYPDGSLLGNPVWVPEGGRLGGAMEFDGNGDLIELAAVPNFNTGGPFTNHAVSLWFRADDVNISSRKQMLFESGGSTRGMNIYLYNGTLYAGSWNADTSESNWGGTWLTSTAVQDGQWHHVVLVLRNGGPTVQPDVVQFYLDGTLVDSGSGSQLWDHSGTNGIGAVNDNTLLHDGSSDTDAGEAFAGRIDQVAIYNRALSSGEVDSLYSGTPGNSAAQVSVSAAGSVGVNTALLLDGSASDAESTPNLNWRQLSGPGTASFVDAQAEDTSVSFDSAGVYLIALVADDGEMAGGEAVSINVGSGMVDDNNNDVPDSWEATHEDATQPGTVKLGDGKNYAIRDVYFWGLDSNSSEPLKAEATSISPGGAFQFQFYGVSGVNYRVLCSTDLSDPTAWTLLTGYENMAGADALLNVSDPSPPAQCVYKVEVVE